MILISYCTECNCKIENTNPQYLKKYCIDCRKERFKGKNNPMYGKSPVYNGIPLNKGMKRGNFIRQNNPIECYFNKNGCLISTRHHIGQDGYPQIFRDGKQWVLSRWVFYINFGYLPQIVMHTCDNPGCINPSHLIAGTIKENSHDMLNKGRAPTGNGGKPKLIEEQVKEIKQKLYKGQSLISIAKEYNVSKKMILYIKQGKKWKHVNIPFN